MEHRSMGHLIENYSIQTHSYPWIRLNNVTYLQDKTNVSVVHGYVNNHVEGTVETETSVSAITDGRQASEVNQETTKFIDVMSLSS